MDKKVFSANAAKGRVVFGLFLIFFLLFVMVFDANAVTGRRYAKPGGLTTGECSSWAEACTLKYALTVADSGQEIWVEKGVYYPGTSIDDRFEMKSGVAVYGGFNGTETLLSERDWVANPTVLSGDIDQDDINKDANGIVTNVSGIVGPNANVVLHSYEVDATGVFDGFVINAGQSTNEGGGIYVWLGSPTLRNLLIIANRSLNSGAGLFNSDGSPTITNVAFRGNSVTNSVEGGGMASFNGSPTLTNVLFSGNHASASGGFASSGGMPVLINATFSGNSGKYGGVIKITNGTATLTNSIVWGNQRAITLGSGSAINVTYSIVQGGYTDNLDVDPQFVNPAPYTSAFSTAGDYHLRFGSPVLDAGNNAGVTALTDLDGKARIVGSTVDMGAYEGPTYMLFLPLMKR